MDRDRLFMGAMAFVMTVIVIAALIVDLRAFQAFGSYGDPLSLAATLLGFGLPIIGAIFACFMWA